MSYLSASTYDCPISLRKLFALSQDFNLQADSEIQLGVAARSLFIAASSSLVSLQALTRGNSGSKWWVNFLAIKSAWVVRFCDWIRLVAIAIRMATFALPANFWQECVAGHGFACPCKLKERERASIKVKRE